MNLFLQSISDVLEVDDIALDTEFRTCANWCSLQGFGILVAMENDWHAALTVERFLGLSTVRDLYREAMIALAAEVFGVGRGELCGSTACGDIAQWDSVNHLRLVMEAERRFGVAYAMEKIPQMKSIDDFLID